MFRFLIGMIVGVLVLVVCVVMWFLNGNPPVAVADAPFPQEHLITSIPLDARIKRDMVSIPPIPPDEKAMIGGARVYAERCAECHGLHGKPSAIGADMFPDAPQLLEKHHNGNVVGVSDDPPGETYWKVFNGIRLTGMPEFKTQLSEEEMWQVSLFLANAEKPMPPAALDILNSAHAPIPEPSAPPIKPAAVPPQH